MEWLLPSPRGCFVPFQEAVLYGLHEFLEVDFLLGRYVSSKPMDGAELPPEMYSFRFHLGV